MAELTVNGKTKQVPDESKLAEVGGEAGINFGCKSAVCQTCLCTVKEGKKNLSEATEDEDLHDLPEGQILACQRKIKEGKVKLEHP